MNGKRRILNQGEYRDWINTMRKDGADGVCFFNFSLRPYCDETWRSVLGAGASQESGVLSIVLDSEVSTVQAVRSAQPTVGWMSWYALKFARPRYGNVSRDYAAMVGRLAAALPRRFLL